MKQILYYNRPRSVKLLDAAEVPKQMSKPLLHLKKIMKTVFSLLKSGETIGRERDLT